MDLQLVKKAVVRWWWLGLIPILIVGIYLGISYQKPPTPYRVTLRFATGGQPSESLSDDYDRYYAWLSSEYIANGLADIATSDSFANRIAESMQQNGVDISPAAVRGAIASDNTQSTTFIYITWHHPAQAVALAEVVADELITNGPEYYPQMAQIGPVARLVDTPVAVPLPVSLRTQLLGPAIRLALAFVVGAGLVLLAYAIDPVIRESEDLSDRGYKVLGWIPRH